jgi:hypothetical protein
MTTLKPNHIQTTKKFAPIELESKSKFSKDIKVIKLKNLSRCIEALIDSEIAMSWRGIYHPQQVKQITAENDCNIKNLNLALHSIQQDLI